MILVWCVLLDLVVLYQVLNAQEMDSILNSKKGEVEFLTLVTFLTLVMFLTLELATFF